MLDTVTVDVDVNDITLIYQAADADDAISVNENVGTGSIDAGFDTTVLTQLVHTVVLLVVLMLETSLVLYLEAQ